MKAGIYDYGELRKHVDPRLLNSSKFSEDSWFWWVTTESNWSGPHGDAQEALEDLSNYLYTVSELELC